VALGVLTVALSTAALTGARWVEGTLTIRRRAFAAALVLLPAGLCHSTIGRLRWPPGTLLLICGVLVVADGRRAAWRGFPRAAWPAGRLGALAACQLLMAAATGSAVTALAGAAALLVLVAAWAPLRPRRHLLIVAVSVRRSRR